MNARLVVKLLKLEKPKAKRWGPLAAPIHASDTDVIARAKSLLVATRGHVDLTAEEARAVIAEHEAKRRD